MSAITFGSSPFPAFSSTEAVLLLVSTKNTHIYQILSEQKKNILPTVDTDSITSFLNNLSIPQLPEELKLSSEGQITMEKYKL